MVSVVLGGICFEESLEAMLSDRSDFQEKVTAGHISNVEEAGQFAERVLRDEAGVSNIDGFAMSVIDPQPPEDIYEAEEKEEDYGTEVLIEDKSDEKFFAMMYLLKNSGISLSDATKLADNAAQNPNAIKLWRDTSSKPVKYSLTILKWVNDLLGCGLTPEKIYEVATDLASGQKSFAHIYNALIHNGSFGNLSQAVFDNLLGELRKNGIEFSEKEIADYVDAKKLHGHS
jgi:hypothetical protein